MSDDNKPDPLTRIRLSYAICPLVMIPLLLATTALTFVLTRSPWCAVAFIGPWHILGFLTRWSISLVSTPAGRKELARREPMLYALTRVLMAWVSHRRDFAEGKQENG